MKRIAHRAHQWHLNANPIALILTYGTAVLAAAVLINGLARA